MRVRDFVALAIAWEDSHRVLDRLFDIPLYSAPVIIVGSVATIASVYGMAAFWDHLGRRDRDVHSVTSD